MAKYRHMGSLIYYPSASSPLKLQDTDPLHGAEKKRAMMKPTLISTPLIKQNHQRKDYLYFG